jgi:hypothetical protein
MPSPQSYPKACRLLLGLKETERAIKAWKDFFELNLATELNLGRSTAPLCVKGGTGINDDLNGVEKARGLCGQGQARHAGGDRAVPGQVEALRTETGGAGDGRTPTAPAGSSTAVLTDLY